VASSPGRQENAPEDLGPFLFRVIAALSGQYSCQKYGSAAGLSRYQRRWGWV
jgi:hypothetical protein